MRPETVLFHQALLRAIKGAVHAYETWLKRITSSGEPTIELPQDTRDRSGETP